ncbi:hypothetical protein ACQKL5_03495 [Peribacillus sp. NPDC097675]|uniref:hypothetical protein n=1 Tax=Peribacillus sp. NPDC097675 TaxID=3390618 RepID=UPI003D05E39D
MNGIMPMTGNLSSFTVAGKKIEPKLNVYTSEDGKRKSYTYILGNKGNVTFYSYFGIPYNGDSKGEVTIEVDGNRIIQRDETWNKEAEKIIVPLFHMMNPKTNMTYSNVNEISITVSGNAKLRDVRFSEQKHWWE